VTSSLVLGVLFGPIIPLDSTTPLSKTEDDEDAVIDVVDDVDADDVDAFFSSSFLSLSKGMLYSEQTLYRMVSESFEGFSSAIVMQMGA